MGRKWETCCVNPRQVDLGLAKTIGDVWISLDTTDLAVQPKLVGAEVGLRDTACATGTGCHEC